MLNSRWFALRGILPALYLVLGVTQANATLIQVGSAGALGANDFVDWGQVRVVDSVGNAVAQASPQNVTSNLGRTASISDGVSFTGHIEGTDWFGNFTVGDHVLYTGDVNDLPAAASMWVLNLNTPVAGLGLQITSDFYGAFTASVEGFNGATSLGILNIAGVMDGNADGTAPFLGAVSNGQKIDKAVFSLTSNTGAGLGVNRLLTTDIAAATSVPEPGTLFILAISLVGLGAARWTGRWA
jgi:hypothetical protein